MIEIENIIERLPDESFMRVKLVNDLYKLHIAELSGKNPGQITVTGFDGVAEEVSPKDLERRFTYLDGKKVKLLYMRRGKAVFVRSKNKTDLAAVFVPKRLTGKKDSYVVFNYANDGSVDRSSCRLYDKKYFRKSCQILMVPRVIRFEGTDLSNTGMEDIVAAKDMDLEMVTPSEEKGFNNSFNMEVLKEEKLNRDDLNPEKPVRKLTAIYTKRDPNNPERVILFGITDGKQTKEMNSAQLIQFAGKGLVTNIGVGMRNNRPYVHGIGILIAELPVETTVE